MIRNLFISKLAEANKCNAIYGISFLFVPGVKGHISNLYVLYVYDFKTNQAIYSVLGHKPRFNDVKDLLDRLEDKQSALLVHVNINPFVFKESQEYFNKYFKYTVGFKARSILGSMFVFHMFLNSILGISMNNYKTSLNDSRQLTDTSPGYCYPEEWVTKAVTNYNRGHPETILDTINLYKGSNYLTELMSVINNEMYTFDIEVVLDTPHYIKFNLYPDGSYDANNILIESVFYIIKTHQPIVNIPYPKAMLIEVKSEHGPWYTVSRTLHLTDTMKLESFMAHFMEAILKLKNRGYPLSNFDYVTLKFIKPLVIENKKITKALKKPSGIRKYSTIRKLKEKVTSNKNLGVLDIETVVLNGVHVVYAIGYKLSNNKAIIYYISDYGKNLKTASQKIMDAFLDDFLVHAKGYYIYCHNLGSFDGYLLLKDLNLKCDKLNILIDREHKFISIDVVNKKINFRDSLRILPASLDSLSKMFDVEIKKGYIDHASVNKSVIFNDDFQSELKQYLYQDLTSLLDVIIKADEYLLEQYHIDLSKCYSASSMAMKIYRTNFIKHPIPILPPHIDESIRKSYRGGATEVYKCSGKKIYFYDMNSLYPYAMLNPMPYNFLDVVENVDLDNFFGFVDAEIFAPKSIFNPFLPYRDEKTGNIIYPHGHFTGTYFSEELKLAKSKGYIVNPKKGYRFSQKELFNEYVTHFYHKKINSQGGERFLYKLMLNSIYGYLGRDLTQLKTQIIKNSELSTINNEYDLYFWTEIDNDHSLILRDQQPSRRLQKLNNIKPNPNSENPKTHTNVAISSAITSYARIAIVPFKTDINNPPFYSDTDSLFLPKPLDDSLIGDQLGQFKDELNGSVITEALFLAPKIYGYKVDDKAKVVIAGVERNTITYDELTLIWKGKTITKSRNLIIKDIHNISVNSKTANLSISLKPDYHVKQPVYSNNGSISHYKPRVLHKTS